MGIPTAYSKFVLPEPILHALSILDLILIRLGLSDSLLQPDMIWPDNRIQTTSEPAPLIRMKSLPVKKFEELVVGGDPPENCAVCLIEFGGREEVGWLKNCKHVFHRACLERWMDHYHNTCPLCRAPLF
ncbi:probable E3 ubiquitin-protein ligase XERICO [Hibiscus syriacus]|uniref:probable E3 ubiquitin-protein ligase XERICO n=1 Tax=Hibiscus syriacus TaxID=106335 RepID=UPI001922B934|nr:probable E3 ubiquitin-protein ligase XERICO [Hibiscus syriacus]